MSILKIPEQVKSDETKKIKNEFNNSPPWRVASFAAGRVPFGFPGYPEKRIKNTNKK
jgi:hypothetical protein